MKKPLGLFLFSLIALSSLTGCAQEADASIEDKTALSIYGKLGNFQVAKWKAGQVLTFTATPEDMYNVGEVLHNNNLLDPVITNPDGSQVYQTVLAPGNNTLVGKYTIKKTVDVVSKYKLSDVITDPDVLDAVIGTTEKGNDHGIDFRRSGIEKMRAPLKYDSQHKKVTDKDAFINYVDGDTTHIESFNLGYTVKIRYLGINTPESTSEIEEWGLTASNYNKFLYSGDASYLVGIDDADDLMQRPNGASSVILISQAAAKGETDPDDPEEEPEVRPMEYDDLMIGSELSVNGPFHATTDGYQRNLAYVWYATVENPTADDYRCLNLEMVYQGLSLGIGSSNDCSEYTYKMFSAANNSAQANKRHIFSLYEDNNYYYYDQYDEGKPETWKWKVQDLTISQLFNSCTIKDDPDVGYRVDSSQLADKKTLRRIGGYVSAIVDTSFYIQEQYEYDIEKVKTGEEKPFGLYIFTLRQMPIRLGDYVEVVGAISTYGGTFQMQGISYTEAEVNPNRDTVINQHGHTRHKCVPLQVTGEQFNSLKLPGVLVEVVDDLYFHDFTTTYQGVSESIAEGGIEEVNKYNESYKFYNTNNTPIFYAAYAKQNEADPSEEIQAKYDADSKNNIRYAKEIIRFTVVDGIYLSYKSETARSWKFFTGGTLYYTERGAQYANIDEDNPYREEVIASAKVYEKKAHKTAFAGHGLVCISRAYESTGGNRKMSGEICSNDPADIRFCLASWTPTPAED